MPRESAEEVRARVRRIITFLKKQYPNARCSLNFQNPHQLMVATILSAQCTDERVNLVTPALFARYPTVQAFADAELADVEQLIYTTGFFRAKARSIVRSAQELLERHNGEMPRQLADLVRLPGVGRKTASVILGAGFGLAEGIVVDTHVGRISRRLGLTRQSDPVKVEQDLMNVIPKGDWIAWSHLLICHGRAVCLARTPRCAACALKRLCPSAVTKEGKMMRPNTGASRIQK